MTKKQANWLPEFMLLAAIWGASFLFMRLGANDFGPWVTAFLRVIIAAAVMLPWVVLRGQWPEFKRVGPRVLLVGVINSAIPFACFSYAVLSITTGLAGILNAATPLFGAAIAWLWLKDRPTGSRTVGLVIGFVGVAMLASGKASFKDGGTGWAVVACLLATLCYGVGASYTKRYLQGVSPMVVATGSQVGAALVLALPGMYFWPSQLPGPQAWACMAALALVCTAFAYWLYFRLMQSAGPSKTLSVTFLIPLFALFYGAVFLQETITSWMLIFGSIIVLGTSMATGLVKFSMKPKKLG